MAEATTRAFDAERDTRGAAGPGAKRCATCGASYPGDFVVCPKDATALERAEGSDEDPLVGEILAGTYCVMRPLGEGGMGRVYEAEHVRLPRTFAVKVLHDSLAHHPEAVARFEREAQAVARVTSEHVLDMVDVARTRDGRPCLVSEKLEGIELGEHLDKVGKLDLATAVTLCRQICRGLVAAHAVGVVHRDLKPSNLFLVTREASTPGLDTAPASRPTIKILDFGVAKLTDGANLTRTGAVIGTPAYMAPEQARGSAVDARADVYAVGAVLYRMLTGTAPFPEGDPAQTLTMLLTEDPVRPRTLAPELPEGIEALIQRAMARDPRDRPATAAELERHLAAFDEARPAANRPASRDPVATADTLAVQAPPVAEEATRRARRARPVALFCMVALAAGVGAAVLGLAAATLPLATGRPRLTETERFLLAMVALLSALVVLAATARALAGRWRNAPAVERLGSALARATATLFIAAGVLTLASQAVAAALPATLRDAGAAATIAPSGAALLLGLTVLAWSRRRG